MTIRIGSTACQLGTAEPVPVEEAILETKLVCNTSLRESGANNENNFLAYDYILQ
jgi:hypothetical protein